MTTNIAFASFDLMLITVLSDIDPIVLEDEPRPLKQQTLFEVYHQTGVRDNAELGLVRATTLSENLGKADSVFVNQYAGPVQIQAKPQQQTLIDIYQQALTNDPALASALSSNQSAQELIEQSKALYRPNINFSAGASASETDIEYIGVNIFRNEGRNSFESRRYSLEARQAIFRKDSWEKINQAKTQVSLADKQYHLSQQNLILRVTEAYFDVLIAQDKIDLIKSQKTAILGQLQQAQANFEVGTSTITDVNEAQARFDLAVSQAIAAENEFLIAQRSIQAITNQLPATLATVKSDIKVAQLGQTIEDWQQVALLNNLNVQMQQDNVAIAEREIVVAKAGHLPTLDAVASYSNSYANSSANGFGSDLNNGTIGIELNIPIYQGGAISSVARQAGFEKQKAQHELDLTMRETNLETQRHYFNLDSTIAQVRALEQALSSTQSQLESTTLGYEVGVRTSIDVLDAQQQLYSSKRDLLQARYNYLVNIIRLKFSAGLLSPMDLEEINNQLLVDS